MKTRTTTTDEHLAGRDLADEVVAVFGRMNGRVDSDVIDVVFDGAGMVRTVEEKGMVRYWQPRSGVLLGETSLSDLDSCWRLSPDGRYVVSGSDSISVWDAASGALLGQLNEPSWLVSLAFSPDGKTVASGHDDHVIRIWDFRTGRLLHSLRGHRDEVCALSYRGDGLMLASAGEDRAVIIWDVSKGSVVRSLEGHTDRVDALAWNMEGQRLVSAGWDTSARVWDVDTGDLIALLNGQGDCVHSVAFLPDGRRLVCGDSNCVVRVWDTLTLKVVHEFRRHRGAVRSLAVSRDGAILASGGTDRCLQFWDLDTGKPLITDHGAVTPVHALTLTPTGRLGVLHTEGRLALWGLESGTVQISLQHPPNVAAADCSNEGHWATATVDGEIAVSGSDSEKPFLTWSSGSDPIRHLRFSPQPGILATSGANEDTVKLWDHQSGQPLLIIPEAAGTGTVEDFRFDGTGNLLAVAGINWSGDPSQDGSVQIWNVAKRSVVWSANGGATRLAFSSDGNFLATISLFDSVIVWDIRNNTSLEIMGASGPINAIAFSPVGSLLACGTQEHGVQFWDTLTGQKIGIIDVESSIRDLVFLPDGSKLIVGTENSACYTLSLESLSLSV